jgi:hypothetical protein
MMVTKMKDDPKWFDRPLMSRIAACMYPGLVDQATRDQMKKIADANGKKSPQVVAEELRNKR